MCNFVPGEALAFGPIGELQEVARGELIGAIDVKSLEPDAQIARNPFEGFGLLHATGIPSGLEIDAVSLISASLSALVKNGKATVGLNYYLPMAQPRFERVKPELSLSGTAANWAVAIREEQRRWHRPTPAPMPGVGLIDSGVDQSKLSRNVVRMDPNAVDARGHGTRVARILDECLPSDVPIISAKISDDDEDVTVLRVSEIFARMVALHRPAVVNLSLAPLDDVFTCPGCGEQVAIPAFHSRLLRHVFATASHSTFVVMAAGNSGQRCNERHIDDVAENLVFAVALDSKWRRAEYSSYPVGAYTDPRVAYAFGGDKPAEGIATEGVFTGESDSYGTSFAAPFVAASLYHAVSQALMSNVPLQVGTILKTSHHLDLGGWIPDSVRFFR